MSIFQRDPRAGAFLGGDRVSGQDIRDQNGAFIIAIRRETSLKCNSVVAAQTVANIVKSSLGPLGLDKMLVDNIGVRLYVPFLYFHHIEPVWTHTGSHDFKRRRHHPFSPLCRTPCWSYLRRSCSKARQRSRRWHDFSRDHRRRAVAPCKRARKSKDSSYHHHHGIQTGVSRGRKIYARSIKREGGTAGSGCSNKCCKD